MNRKVQVFFGPPLARLTASGGNTMEISGRLNRTAERYLEIMRHHGLELSEAERACVAHACDVGFVSPEEIRELPFEVKLSSFEMEGLDKEALAAKLGSAGLADLVSLVESLGF